MLVRRSAFVLALAALTVSPAAALAQGAPRAGAMQFGLLAGIEDEDGPAGFQLRGDLEFSHQRLSPAVTLSFVGSLGYSRFHDEITDFFVGERWEATTNVLRFAPTARFAFGAHPVFRPYLDASAGLYYASGEIEYTDLTFGDRFSVSDDEVSVFLRLAAGVSFQVAPTFALGAELGLMPYFGDLDLTSTSLLASATFRL